MKGSSLKAFFYGQITTSTQFNKFTFYDNIFKRKMFISPTNRSRVNEISPWPVLLCVPEKY